MEDNNSKIIFIDITSFNTQDDCNMVINTMKQFYNTETSFKLILETKDLTVNKIIQSVYQLSKVSLNSFKKHKIQYLRKPQSKFIMYIATNCSIFIYIFQRSGKFLGN